jgi:hypothetical protein
MQIEFEDKEYQFELDEIDLRQASLIYDKCGLTLMGLELGLGEGTPTAMRAIYWLMHAQNGEELDIDRLNFKVVKFAIAIREAGQKAEEAEKAANKSAPKARAAKAAPRA